MLYPRYKAWLRKEKVMLNPEDLMLVWTKRTTLVFGRVDKSKKNYPEIKNPILLANTGLSDNKQKSLYDSYILQDDAGKLTIVRWERDRARFSLEDPLEPFNLKKIDHLQLILLLRIIGNTFENSELIDKYIQQHLGESAPYIRCHVCKAAVKNSYCEFCLTKVLASDEQ